MIQSSLKNFQPILIGGRKALTTIDPHRQSSKQPILVSQSSTLQKKINNYALEVTLFRSDIYFHDLKLLPRFNSSLLPLGY